LVNCCGSRLFRKCPEFWFHRLFLSLPRTFVVFGWLFRGSFFDLFVGSSYVFDVEGPQPISLFFSYGGISPRFFKFWPPFFWYLRSSSPFAAVLAAKAPILLRFRFCALYAGLDFFFFFRIFGLPFTPSSAASSSFFLPYHFFFGPISRLYLAAPFSESIVPRVLFSPIFLLCQNCLPLRTLLRESQFREFFFCRIPGSRPRPLQERPHPLLFRPPSFFPSSVSLPQTLQPLHVVSSPRIYFLFFVSWRPPPPSTRWGLPSGPSCGLTPN